MIMPARGSISYLVFSIVTCAESIARPTISETLLSPLFRRGSRSNHTPKLILWLGLKSSTPIARAISFIGPFTISVAIGGIADMTGNAAGSTRSRMFRFHTA
jgi:hypothetical protein